MSVIGYSMSALALVPLLSAWLCSRLPARSPKFSVRCRRCVRWVFLLPSRARRWFCPYLRVVFLRIKVLNELICFFRRLDWRIVKSDGYPGRYWWGFRSTFFVTIVRVTAFRCGSGSVAPALLLSVSFLSTTCATCSLPTIRSMTTF